MFLQQLIRYIWNAHVTVCYSQKLSDSKLCIFGSDWWRRTTEMPESNDSLHFPDVSFLHIVNLTESFVPVFPLANTIHILKPRVHRQSQNESWRGITPRPVAIIKAEKNHCSSLFLFLPLPVHLRRVQVMNHEGRVQVRVVSPLKFYFGKNISEFGEYWILTIPIVLFYLCFIPRRSCPS